jgi:hypothetical protein
MCSLEMGMSYKIRMKYDSSQFKVIREEEREREREMTVTTSTAVNYRVSCPLTLVCSFPVRESTDSFFFIYVSDSVCFVYVGNDT